MPISPTNVSKNVISPTGVDRTNRYFFLLRENGSYLLQENSGKIILTSGLGTFSNTSKNTISPTNLAKS